MEDLPKKLKLTFVGRKRSEKILEPAPPTKTSIVTRGLAAAGNWLFYKVAGRFSANPNASTTAEKKPEPEVGEIFKTKKEKKASEKLAKMSETFTHSKERCVCRLTEITLQIKNTPRTDANKSKLVALLKRRKQLKRQIVKIENAASSIDEYRYIVTDASIDKDIMDSVVELKKVVKTATKSSLGSSADKAAKKVGKAVDDLEDLKDDMAEFSDILDGINLNNNLDDDELLAEIDTWTDNDDDAKQDGYPFGPGNNGASVMVAEEAVPPVLPPLPPLPPLPQVPIPRPLLDVLPEVPTKPPPPPLPARPAEVVLTTETHPQLEKEEKVAISV